MSGQGRGRLDGKKDYVYIETGDNWLSCFYGLSPGTIWVTQETEDWQHDLSRTFPFSSSIFVSVVLT
jgi:hypothetical protein